MNNHTCMRCSSISAPSCRVSYRAVCEVGGVHLPHAEFHTVQSARWGGVGGSRLCVRCGLIGGRRFFDEHTQRTDTEEGERIDNNNSYWPKTLQQMMHSSWQS